MLSKQELETLLTKGCANCSSHINKKERVTEVKPKGRTRNAGPSETKSNLEALSYIYKINPEELITNVQSYYQNTSDDSSEQSDDDTTKLVAQNFAFCGRCAGFFAEVYRAHRVLDQWSTLDNLISKAIFYNSTKVCESSIKIETEDSEIAVSDDIETQINNLINDDEINTPSVSQDKENSQDTANANLSEGIKCEVDPMDFEDYDAIQEDHTVTITTDNECYQPDTGNPPSSEEQSEVTINPATDGDDSDDFNDSTDCNSGSGIQVTASDLLESTKMSEIKLKRIRLQGHKIGITSTGSGFGDPRQQKSHKVTQKSTVTRQFRNKTNVPKTTKNKKLSNPVHAPKKSEVEKPIYKCSFCEKIFPSRTIQKVHERVHTGEKPFKCSFCEKRFAQAGAIKMHERVHTGEKPFKCSFCKRGFALKSGLLLHERKHTGEKPFKCSYCKKRYANQSGLRYHEKRHTEEKPLKCSFCEKCFAKQYRLQIHEKSHNPETSFKCSYCPKVYKQKSNRNTHQKLHKKKVTR